MEFGNCLNSSVKENGLNIVIGGITSETEIRGGVWTT